MEEAKTVETEPVSDNAIAEDNGGSEASAPSQPQADDFKDQLLRALAEVENTRRRAQKDIDETRKYAVSNFAKEMLAVADNFRRALESVPAEARENEAVKQVMMGIDATERQLAAAFEKFGIKKMEPAGQLFDPNLHRVMMEEENHEHPKGTVLRVLQSGYTIGDRLLREALVTVAKGGSVQHKVDTSA